MSQQKNLVYFGIGRIKDKAILGSYTEKLAGTEKNEVETAFSNFLADRGRLTPEGRDKRHFAMGTMFMVCDRQFVCVYALVSRNKTYPDRIGYQAIKKVKDALAANQNVPAPESMQSGDMSRFIRMDAKAMMNQFDSPANVDSISNVNQKVNEVQGIMLDNIEKVTNVGGKLNDLEYKAQMMNQNAENLCSNTKALKDKMKMRQRKLYIIGGVMITLTICYVTLGVCSVLGVI